MRVLRCLPATLAVVLTAHSQPAPVQWEPLSPGLELTRTPLSRKSFLGDSVVTVVRIDPARYSFRLLCASEHKKRQRTAKEWATEFGLTAVINAGMFQQDYLTSTALMRNFTHINNPSSHPDYNGFLVFNPNAPSLREVRLLDRDCDDVGSLLGAYSTVIQDLRMISCHGKNLWSRQERRWSLVALGEDRTGKILFLFTRSPYSVHDFIEELLRLDLGLTRALYLEGGPEASLYLKSGRTELALCGSYETGFHEVDDLNRLWPIPNVIGIAAKPAPGTQPGR